ncbi:bifunctional 4-hydroxy-2-oxoglutarate aldolase/2-dehydro-3-deoxy-phosphogluconate aldolase [uncultured Victivallis sp.]|uniref:bifunctional 4-hydroxy-2-oxoglutarate aldolase/2-dehydro-3-deoxy-phosphogluconate aldolase n=1 Tax=uncultured Victivallis sp. TaxID=354118 RepID=UPI0025993DAE|nr:bifunctional 4-hydroxy-2-oxoglutarate aldolase/2-dehydro-3-deoxy-phosphogluconate aldolase [uncultured Victivallis sp.]
MNQNFFAEIAELGILPVISIPSADLADGLSDALCAGNVKAIEITLRSDCALEAIQRIRNRHPKMLLAAGTVLTPKNAEQAIHAGANCLVSPGFSESLICYCMEHGYPILPGCVSAAEIQRGMELGLRYFKFFPAESCGGLKALKLLSGPFSQCRFIPTGGMTFDNIGSYLEEPFIAACGGSYMASTADVAAGRWDLIEANCRRAMDISLGFTLAHVGLNAADAGEAESAARRMALLFRLPLKIGNSSIFAGTAVEHMKMPFRGTHGHIGFYTRSVTRALAFYHNNGIPVCEDSIRYDAKGEMQSFYLAEEIGGFAVHVVKK